MAGTMPTNQKDFSIKSSGLYVLTRDYPSSSLRMGLSVQMTTSGRAILPSTSGNYGGLSITTGLSKVIFIGRWWITLNGNEGGHSDLDYGNLIRKPRCEPNAQAQIYMQRSAKRMAFPVIWLGNTARRSLRRCFRNEIVLR